MANMVPFLRTHLNKRSALLDILFLPFHRSSSAEFDHSRSLLNAETGYLSPCVTEQLTKPLPDLVHSTVCGQIADQ